jgi:chemotaxis protein MotB
MDEEEVEKKEPPAELTCPEWMMTMGDCMSLLLTFFVLLLTFSTTSQSRLMDVIGVMKGAFSFIETTNLINKEETAYNDNASDEDNPDSVKHPKDASSIRLSSNSIQKKFKDLSESLSDVGFKYPLEVKKLAQGYSIEVSIDDIFVGETTVLTANGQKLVSEVANVSFNINNEIRIMSYLNPEYMKGSKLGNAWVTSLERNHKLADVLNDKFNIKKSRFSIGTSVMSDADLSKNSKNYSIFKIIFMEKLDIKSVSISELLKDSPQ